MLGASSHEAAVVVTQVTKRTVATEVWLRGQSRLSWIGYTG